MLKKFAIYWLPVFVWMGLIFFLSSFHKLQSTLPGWQDYLLRKLAHFLEYTVLCILFFRGFKGTIRITATKAFILSILLTIAYAMSDEFHQTFVLGRSGKLFDVGIDSLGAIFGMAIAFNIVKLLPKKVRKILQ